MMTINLRKIEIDILKIKPLIFYFWYLGLSQLNEAKECELFSFVTVFTCWPLNQWFLNLSLHQNHMEGLLKQVLKH